MIEAIGEKQFPVFFDAVDRLLVPGGRACVQTILIPDERWPRYRKTPDWIERHVFPGVSSRRSRPSRTRWRAPRG